MRLSTKKLLLTRRFVNREIISLFGVRHRPGEIGLELEVEGRNIVDAPNPPVGWSKIKDGSLRGDSAEFILTNPIKRENLHKALDALYEYYGEAGIVLNNSYRTSVHVHLNMQKAKLRQVISLLCLYTCFESLLVNTKICGRERLGNLFCLRYSDAEVPLIAIQYALKSCHVDYIREENRLKYSALNIATLSRFGSLEFRMMRGLEKKEDIDRWVRILLKLKDFALALPDPSTIPGLISEYGPIGLIREVFGDYSEYLLAGQDQHELSDDIFDAMQGIQDLCFYLEDWSEPPKEQEEAPAEDNFNLAAEIELPPIDVRDRFMVRNIAIGVDPIINRGPRRGAEIRPVVAIDEDM